MMILAKDARGIAKSMGGDVFSVTWSRVGSLEPPMTGRVRPSTLILQADETRPYIVGYMPEAIYFITHDWDD